MGNRLYVGGEFGKFNGKEIRGLVAINASTGALITSFRLPLADSRDRFPPYVQELDVSPNGRWLVIGGNFQQVGRAKRTQVAVIDLSGSAAKVAPWSTKRYVGDCATSYDDTYIRGVDISPDNKFFVVNTTGAYVGYNRMCDSTARWELPPTASGGGLQPTWVDHTGGDTFWAVEVTESAVYVGGHMRWLNNPRPSPEPRGDNDGPGAVSRAGIAALDPYSGVPLSWNPGRDRGRGAEALHATDDYLMVGSDTPYFAGQLRQRLALLPVTGGTPNPAPQVVPLPVRLFYATGDTLKSMRYDGQTFGPTTTGSGPGIDGVSWAGNRDGFVQRGKLQLLRQVRGVLESGRSPPPPSAHRRPTSPRTVGYVDDDADLTPFDQPYGVAETRTAAFFGGRVLYTKTGDSQAVLPLALAAERDPRRLRVRGLDRELERCAVDGVHRRRALRGVERQQAVPVLARRTACRAGAPGPSSTTATPRASRGRRRRGPLGVARQRLTPAISVPATFRTRDFVIRSANSVERHDQICEFLKVTRAPTFCFNL